MAGTSPAMTENGSEKTLMCRTKNRTLRVLFSHHQIARDLNSRGDRSYDDGGDGDDGDGIGEAR
jgi:hypothetical protein